MGSILSNTCEGREKVSDQRRSPISVCLSVWMVALTGLIHLSDLSWSGAGEVASQL